MGLGEGERGRVRGGGRWGRLVLLCLLRLLLLLLLLVLRMLLVLLLLLLLLMCVVQGVGACGGCCLLPGGRDARVGRGRALLLRLLRLLLRQIVVRVHGDGDSRTASTSTSRHESGSQRTAPRSTAMVGSADAGWRARDGAEHERAGVSVISRQQRA